MFKRMIILTVALSAAAFSLWSEAPKIAVLDVTIPKGFDSSVVIPVTQAGKFLGASYVIVSKIQLVGGAYFLSAKMIDTLTAAIVTQASDSQKGDASVVIGMAQNVGAKLAGVIIEGQKPVIAESETKIVSERDTPKPSPVPSPSPTPQPPAEPAPGNEKTPVFRIVADLSLPSWSGKIGTTVKSSDILLESHSLANNPDTLDIGFEAYAHLNLGRWFYLAAEFDYFSSLMKDASFPSSSAWYTDMTLSNIMGGLGLSIPLDFWGQIYAGALVGAGTFDVGDLWTRVVRNKVQTAGGTFNVPSTTDSGLAYALEVGASVFIAHFLTIDFRFRYGGSVFDASRSELLDWYVTDLGTLPTLEYSTLAFGIGLSL